MRLRARCVLRRRQGWSQRQLAARTGIAASTIAAVEAGRRQPSLAALRTVLGSAGWELCVDDPAPAPTPELLRFLGRSLTRRLERAIGADRPPLLRRQPLWQQLRHLASSGDVVLHGQAAVALWLPREQPLQRLEVCWRRRMPFEPRSTPDVELQPACEVHVRALVQVSLESWLVGVDPPGELALRAAHSAQRPQLRAAARVLHHEAARDLAGRRVAAHKDPAHREEESYVFHTKAFGRRRMPDADDRRGWRLADDASLAAWLRRYGYRV